VLHCAMPTEAVVTHGKIGGLGLKLVGSVVRQCRPLWPQGQGWGRHTLPPLPGGQGHPEQQEPWEMTLTP
jgi:hypothetical protein